MAKCPTPIPIIDSIEHINNIKHQDTTQYPNDLTCVVEFLKQYSGNKATFESYRREVERLLQWAWHIEQKSVLMIKRQDLERYITFCLKPLKSWIALKKVPRFFNKNGQRIPNPLWRPFVATVSKYDHKQGLKPDKSLYYPSQKTIQEIFTGLNSFYNYLALEEKIPFNPIALIKQKSKYLQKRQKQAPVMRLTELQWQTCLEVAKKMAMAEPDKHERTLFMITAFYLLYLRISELVASPRWIPQMGHFYQDSNAHWWFKTVGKGNKMRDIAVSENMLMALRHYRKSMNLPPLPLPNEKSPLLTKEKGKGPVTSSRHIRRLIQLCFDKAVYKLKQNHFETEATNLESATVHWLRHTGISDDINKRNRPVAHVRNDAGHSSSAITDRYNDIELTERYKLAKNKKAEFKSLEIKEKIVT